MSIAAKILDDVIVDTIVADMQWVKDNFEGLWIDISEQKAGIGYTYNNGDIRAPKPFESWVYENNKWNAPIGKPSEDEKWIWDEELVNWKEFIIKGYRIYQYQKDALLKQTMIDGTKYTPIQDVNGDWFIFEKEYQHCNIGELMDYIPPTEII